MGPGKVGALIGGVAVLLWLASGLYQVQPSEVGVPLVFGKSSGELTENGLHWNWPAPVGSVLTPNVYQRNQVEIGFRPGTSSGVNIIDEESLMLTGDENIVQVEAVVQWHIEDVEKYLFEIRDPVESKAADEPKNDTGRTPQRRRSARWSARNTFEYLLTTGRGPSAGWPTRSPSGFSTATTRHPYRQPGAAAGPASGGGDDAFIDRRPRPTRSRWSTRRTPISTR
jgi:hypothetical protein